MKYTILETALKEYGTKEVPGDGNNPEVVKYYRGNAVDDSVPWCDQFVDWCLVQNGLEGTKPMTARSYMDYGMPIALPRLGDIVVFWRGSKDGWQGHVGFYISEDENNIFVLGGNQSDQVNIKPYAKSRLLGYRRPQDIVDHVNESSCEQQERTNSLLVKIIKIILKK